MNTWVAEVDERSCRRLVARGSQRRPEGKHAVDACDQPTVFLALLYRLHLRSREKAFDRFGTAAPVL